MKKKIGIITITGLGNYGNRLQNYALQQVIEKIPGCKCETLHNNSCRLKGYIKKIVMPKRHTLSEREQKFQEFNNEFISFTDISISNIAKDRRLLEYDCLVCGSDQIWNSDFPENDRANFGYFFAKQTVISYAASFGTDTVAESKRTRYAKYLNRMKAISVREEKGKEIAEQLTGRNDVFVHLDPTLLLTEDEWSCVEKRPEQYRNEKYILKYFLGSENIQLDKEIEMYAQKHELKIIDAISPSSIYCNIGPSEFLFLEKNAELIVTDSFHACAFSVIYKKPFIVAERQEKALQGMGSRIDTLLKHFQLENQKYTGDNFDQLIISSVNYQKTEEIIELEKKRSIEYLKENI